MNATIPNYRFDKLVPVLGSCKNLGTSYEPSQGVDLDDAWIVCPGYYFELFDAINYGGILGAIDNRWGTTIKAVTSDSVYKGQNRVASVKVYTYTGAEVTIPLFS